MTFIGIFRAINFWFSIGPEQQKKEKKIAPGPWPMARLGFASFLSANGAEIKKNRPLPFFFFFRRSLFICFCFFSTNGRYQCTWSVYIESANRQRSTRMMADGMQMYANERLFPIFFFLPLLIIQSRENEEETLRVVDGRKRTNTTVIAFVFFFL